MSRPFKRIFPEFDFNNPLMMLIKVVFPEPFGPTRPDIIPDFIFKFMSLSAEIFPNDLQIFFNSIT